MNADLKRVRDTNIDDGRSPIKRRALGSATPPPVQSDDGDAGEDWQQVVETHRKEAIYRQMLEYRRGQQREKQRADEVDAQRRKLEASHQAFEICWNQVVEAVRASFPVEATSVDQSLQPWLDPQLPLEELKSALETRLPATKQLITSISASTASSSKPVANEQLQTRCMHLQAESSTLKANSQKLQSEITSLTISRDALHRDLVKAQKALDRRKMEHDKAEKEWLATREKDREAALMNNGKRSANGSGHATPNGKLEEDVKRSPTAEGTAELLQNSLELEQQKRIAETRLKTLEALRADYAAAQQEVDRLRQLVEHPSEAQLRDSPFFQVYLQSLATQTNRADNLQQRNDTNERKLDEMRNNNLEFQQAMIAQARTEAEALRQQNERKDGDLARIRGQRDDLTAELAERKARDTDRMTFAEQMEKLASSRETRIKQLSSEVRILKGRLGAQSGSSAYLAFLQEDGGIDGDYVKSLETKLENAESRLSVLSQELQASNDGSLTDVAEVRAELDTTRRILAKYESILGPNANAAEDVRQLAQKLGESEKEREKLKMSLTEAENATNALFGEIDGLSKLWEGLDKTVNDKVLELKDGELKMSRLATEKAKADNKYFQAMRLKEALDVESKTAQRSVEKQLKMLERAQATEKSLNAQIASHEKGLTTLKNQALALQNDLATVTSEKVQLEHRLQQSQSSLSQAQALMHRRVTDYNDELRSKEKAMEDLDAALKQIKALEERQEELIMASSAGAGVSASKGDTSREDENIRRMLRCSTCNLRWKERINVKCGHTFCKFCLEERVRSRERKCPACGISFAKEDIQAIYWQ